MFPDRIYNINIVSEKLLPTPREIKEKLPLSAAAEDTVYRSRQAMQNILDRKDDRIFVILGPCSIHDLKAARDYADRLSTLAPEISDCMLPVMRVYFEKPRTSVGWKGFINDPYLDDSFNIDEGLLLARKLLLEIAEMGLAAGTEALDQITPQYLHDLISWTAIGARTTESQTHREMASGLSTPVGFKNGTDGNTQVAINALKSVSRSHHFLGIDRDGRSAVMETSGNKFAHIVLRGGTRPNYDSVNVALVEKDLSTAGLPLNVVIDCSHGNSLKDPALQPLVFENCIGQIVSGTNSIVGLMLESNIEFGSQSLSEGPSSLRYGVSVTDGCIDWNTTRELLLRSADVMRSARNRATAR
jgi:3-deoxy-7-phosphoheptulonate synthase